MNRYAMLANPGHNRIYFETSMKIAVSELEALSQAFDLQITEITEGDLGLPASICFNTSRELSAEDFKVLGFSSIYYALFEVMESGLLKPIQVPDFHTFPEGMVKILKYTGKTNEQFTRLMVNLGLSACQTNSEKITLCDPMCGKGTTLYEGFIRGFDVRGIEINAKWAQEIQTYVRRFLKEGRFKHRAEKLSRLNARGKKFADGFQVEAAFTKDAFKAGDTQFFQMFHADTRKANLLIKNKSIDMIVSDLPYGVQHGSKQAQSTSMERSPLELMKAAVPAWVRMLKQNGSMVLSFNELTMKYEDLATLLEKNGLSVQEQAPFTGFIHRVDQSINRNLIVAVKK